MTNHIPSNTPADEVLDIICKNLPSEHEDHLRAMIAEYEHDIKSLEENNKDLEISSDAADDEIRCLEQDLRETESKITSLESELDIFPNLTTAISALEALTAILSHETPKTHTSVPKKPSSQATYTEMATFWLLSAPEITPIRAKTILNTDFCDITGAERFYLLAHLYSDQGYHKCLTDILNDIAFSPLI